ncbi:MAG: lipopolysaccharide biosynthesis protein [Armatimonadetes bacterium]|nr:lipopolysaccharide biosynthesis protein [Armatimonadota bacterium]
MSDGEARSSLVKRIVRGVAANGFGQVVTLLSGVVTVPLFMRYWGQDLFGEWLFLSSIPTYLSMSGFGFGTTAGSDMTMLVAQGKRLEALRVLQTAWLLSTVLTVGVVGVAMVVCFVAPLDQWFKNFTLSPRECLSILTVLLLSVAVAQQGSLIDSVAKAIGMFDRNVFFMNVMRLCEVVAGIVVVVAGGDPWCYAWTLIVFKVVTYLSFWAWYRRIAPWLYLGWRYAGKDTLKPMVGPALTFSAFNLGYAMSIQGILILVGAFLSPAATALFGPLRTLTRVVLQAATALGNTVWPELSRAVGAGDLGLARRLHRKSIQITFWIVAPSSVVLFFIGPWVFAKWTTIQGLDPLLLGLLLVVTLFGSLWGVSSSVPLSINKHQSTAYVFIATTTGVFALAAALVKQAGLVGVAVAMVIGEAVMLAFVWQKSWSLLHEDPKTFLAQVLTPPVPGLRRSAAPGPKDDESATMEDPR